MSSHTGMDKTEYSSSESWHRIDDVLETINSLSRISYSPKSRTSAKTNSQSHDESNTSITRNMNGYEDTHSYNCATNKNDSENLKIPAYGLGRGQYIKTLENYNQQLHMTNLDQTLHEELQQVNGCGYSNELIEQRFGSSFEYYNPYKAALQPDRNVSSAALEPIEAEQFDNLPCADSSQGDYFPDQKSKLEDTKPPADLSSEESCSKAFPELPAPTSCSKKRKQRKCRNFVVLNFTSNKCNTAPELKSPNSYLNGSSPGTKASKEQSSVLDKSESMFSEDDFPALC